MNKRIAVVDIETTGGSFKNDFITEVGIVIVENAKIIKQFETLVNPGISIPRQITRLTGISNEMVADAPRFYEVAKEVVEWTDGCIFAAHNSRFDYSFIREELKRLGFTYTRKQLCTRRLTKLTFPFLPSYSLGNLIKHFGLNVENRHRALADAKAAAELLINCMNDTGDFLLNEVINQGVKESRLPENINLEKLHSIPDSCGVYYFTDRNGDIVYVGKSKNLQKRVMEHFAKTTNKAAQLQQAVFDINYEESGSELMALIHESEEIKRLNPPINKAQRSKTFLYGIFYDYDENGYITFEVKRLKGDNRLGLIKEFPRLASAKAYMLREVKAKVLCHKLGGLEKGPGPCFYAKINQCLGGCIGKENPDSYNERALELIGQGTIEIDNMAILGEGRDYEEQSVVLIKNGELVAYGYMERETPMQTIQELEDNLTPVRKSMELNNIVKNYIRKNRVKKITIPE